MLEALRRPARLDKSHSVELFECGKSPLNRFLRFYALQIQAAGGARTYVLARGSDVVGYYTLEPVSIALEDTSPQVQNGQERYPVPVILMARFALDINESNRGPIAALLLRDALGRALVDAEAIGGRAFMVYAEDCFQQDFYWNSGMEAATSNPTHLFLSFKDIRHTLAQTP